MNQEDAKKAAFILLRGCRICGPSQFLYFIDAFPDCKDTFLAIWSRRYNVALYDVDGTDKHEPFDAEADERFWDGIAKDTERLHCRE